MASQIFISYGNNNRVEMSSYNETEWTSLYRRQIRVNWAISTTLSTNGFHLEWIALWNSLIKKISVEKAKLKCSRNIFFVVVVYDIFLNHNKLNGMSSFFWFMVKGLIRLQLAHCVHSIQKRTEEADIINGLLDLYIPIDWFDCFLFFFEKLHSNVENSI